jgi:hopanoid C-2 methylase
MADRTAIRSSPPMTARRHGTRRRALIVNAYIDGMGRQGRRRTIPQALAPAMLAGALDPSQWTIRLYNEHVTGDLRDFALLQWPDVLVLTGLTSSLDRMLQLTAYARTLNPSVIVVAGGPAVRAMPALARRFFDYACRGDVEELRDVIRDVCGEGYVTEGDIVPRYDLAPWLQGRFGYVEATRNCNFRCAFCSIAGEGRRYQSLSVSALRGQIGALSNPRDLIFLDNNFFGSDRAQFHARVNLIEELRARGVCSSWAALVTQDFFANPDHLTTVRRSGCLFLFSGVESFDERALQSFNKKQNTAATQLATIATCLDAGVAFLYGIVLDNSTRSIADMRREIDFILDTDSIPLPCYFSFAVPLPGTAFFRRAVSEGQFRPNVLLRDLHGMVPIVQSQHDELTELRRFADDLSVFRGYGRRAIAHAATFAARNRSRLGSTQLTASMLPVMMLCKPESRVNRGPRLRAAAEAFQPLRTNATPLIRVDSSFEEHFKSVPITDADGSIAEALLPDLGPLAS